jgi:hypothetical protein
VDASDTRERKNWPAAHLLLLCHTKRDRIKRIQLPILHVEDVSHASAAVSAIWVMRDINENIVQAASCCCEHREKITMLLEWQSVQKQ